MNYIYVVSDSTGGTAERALNAALVQFADVAVDIKIRPEVRTEEQVHQVIHEAVQDNAFIVHTLVKDELRQLMGRMGREHNIETIDLMGPLLARLSHQFAVSPAGKPGLFRELNEEYFRRIETMDFAIKHDDGQRIYELPKAEIVLLGVSRTFKTPLSIFLAFKGWFVANIPIILGIKPPSILSQLPPDHVFCLNTYPHRLLDLRRIRQNRLGKEATYYTDLDYIRRELNYARNFFSRHPKWTVINVTSKAIEEIASEILAKE